MCGQRSLYDQFATYLTQNGLHMESQFSADNFNGQLANQTNLAVKVCLSSMCLVGILSLRCLTYSFKSIVALRAASEIFQMLGDNDKSKQYNVRPLSSFIVETNLIRISVPVYRHLVPGTVADDRARIGPNSLHAFLRKQHIVSVVFAVTVMTLR